MKTRAGKKEGYYRTPDYHIRKRPHTAKFKVVRNVRLFTTHSIDSNLQDEIAGQDGVRKRTFCKFDVRRSFGNIDNKDSKQKYLWSIVKQLEHGLFSEVVNITGPEVLDAWDYFPPLASESSLTQPTPRDQ